MKRKEFVDIIDYIKANRRGSREAELEFSCGWKSTTKPHKSKKLYTRKSKYKCQIS